MLAARKGVGKTGVRQQLRHPDCMGEALKHRILRSLYVYVRTVLGLIKVVGRAAHEARSCAIGDDAQLVECGDMRFEQAERTLGECRVDALAAPCTLAIV